MGYTTIILKAGALLPDTVELFLNWDEATSIEDNLERLRNSNVFGKTTRDRVKVMLRIFRNRYLLNKDLSDSLSVLAKTGTDITVLRPILYFFSVYADDLLRDTVLLFVAQRRAVGQVYIDTDDLKQELVKWIGEGRIHDDWSENTLTKVSRGLLSTLRDFGILEGAANKKIAPVYLPIEAFAYLAYFLKTIDTSSDLLVKNSLWGIFFLMPTDVERLLVQAEQLQLLTYQAAGSVIRINFPVDDLKEYAHVIARTANRIA
ncbi:MAG: DUF1819 family protein [Anaerolineae bacterium]|nr:DUF1819 family protein [Anaerolineae bacterium]